MNEIAVLVVDDDENIIAMFKRVFSRDPIFHMDAALRGYQAVALATKYDYDALICDIDLPDMDGSEIVNELKLKKRLPPLVIYISGAVRSAPRNKTIGDTFFIRKPFNPSEIISILMANRRR
jgi:DNA-binding response OmpR family regulator